MAVPRRPPRIEHGGVVTDEQAALAATLGVAIVTQPGFMPELGVQMQESMGPKRTPLIHRHKGLLKAGVMVAGSSDRPVATGRPLSIIQSMVDRLAGDGSVVGPEERVSVRDAFWTYTVGSAQTTGMADRKGMLKPGFLGDVVVLSGDPLHGTVESIAGLEVLHSVVGGQVTLNNGKTQSLHTR